MFLPCFSVVTLQNYVPCMLPNEQVNIYYSHTQLPQSLPCAMQTQKKKDVLLGL